MRSRALACLRWCALMAFGALAVAQAAVPVGCRYVGSRLVSEGRVVYWYWDLGHVEMGPGDTSFVARMYARAVDVNQERPYVAIIRCDTRTYREMGAPGLFQSIEAGEPVDVVWRTGCSNGRAVPLALRLAQMGEAAPAASAVARAPVQREAAVPTAPAPPPSTPSPAVAPAKSEAPRPERRRDRDDAADPRRADACLRFSDTTTSAAGEGTITNTCAFPIEVTLCYRGRNGGIFDCPSPVKGRRSDSLAPGVTHALPEYRRARHKGIAAVACKGTMGTVFPRLDDAAGKSGCY